MSRSLDEIWADDLLDRRREAEFLVDFLAGNTCALEERGRGAFVVNLDAEWGAGKSFFMKHLAQHLRLSDFVVVEVDAWADDHMDDPFVAVISAIDDAFSKFIPEREPESAWRTAKHQAITIVGRTLLGAGRAAAKRYLDSSLDELLDIKEDKPTPIGDAAGAAGDTVVDELSRLVSDAGAALIDNFKAEKAASENFKSRLSATIEAIGKERPKPIFLLIDEVDRCRPSFALSILERVKHLFDVSGLCILFATNSGQLQHTVQGSYGAQFAGMRYLKRFFSASYLMQTPEISAFVKQELADINRGIVRAPKNDFENMIIGCVAAYGLDLRSTQHVIGLIRSVCAAWRPRHPIESTLLVPIAVHFYKEGNVDLVAAERSIPDDWRIPLGYQGSPLGRSTLKYLNIKSTFSLQRTIMESLRGASENYRDGGNNPDSDYAGGTFIPEWNGVPIKPDQRRVQTAIPDLVASAGRVRWPEASN